MVRNPPRVEAKRGDHFLQADFSLLIRSTSSTPFVDNFLFADDSGAVLLNRLKMKLLSENFRLYFCGPKTSRNATLRSSSARAQSPVKLEPCMMASVLGFRSASFFKFCAVSGV